MNKYVKYFLILLLISALTAEVIWLIHHSGNALQPITEKQQIRDLQKVESLLLNSKPHEAHEIMKKYKPAIGIYSDKEREWLDNFITVYTQLHQPIYLLNLYENYPEIFQGHESASLLVSETYLQADNLHEYTQLRSRWRGHENHLANWYLLDAEKFHRQGKTQEAIEILSQKQFKGNEEIKRLALLSKFLAKENPEKARSHLEKAARLNPSHPEVYLSRAKIFEDQGKNVQAHMEHLKAIERSPENPFYKDELAEFYLRQNKIAHAIEVWMKDIQEENFNFILLKAYFWSRVIQPIGIQWDQIEPQAGFDKQLIEYLFNLPPNQFWDDSKFPKVSDNNRYLTTIQPLYWLQLLHALQKKNATKALWIMKNQSFGEKSFNPALEDSLQQILKESDNEFPQKQIIQRFIEAGWEEAAIKLYKNGPLTKDLALQMAKILRKNRSVDAALAFAKEQPASPELSLYIAELQLEIGKKEVALATIKEIAQTDTQASLRANWLLSLHLIDQGKLSQAKEVIYKTPGLEDHVLGKEALAIIALEKGDQRAAEEIYRSIKEQSTAAKSYLAEQKFQEGEKEEALQLTEELLYQFPNHPVLHHNRKKILQSETADRIP